MPVPGTPVAPVLLRPDTHSLYITWTTPSAPQDEPVIDFDLQYRTSAGPGNVPPAGNWAENRDVPESQIGRYVLANLHPMQSYDIQVRAVNASGDSPWSPSLTATTLEIDDMANLNSDLTKLQFGLEAAATPGTLVAATRLVPFLSGTYLPTRERNNVEEMRGLIGDYEDVVVGRMSELTISQALDYENVLPAFLCGFQAAAPVGNALVAWTFTPGRETVVDLRTATIELAETDGASAHFRRRFGFARPTQIGIELAEGVAQLNTTWMGRAAQALTTPADVAALPRSLIPARRFEVYIDDTWATLGTTKIGNVRTASINYTTGVAAAYNKDGRSDLDITDWYRGRFQGAISLTVDHNEDTTDEFTHWEDGDLRFIRIVATEGSGPSIRTLRLDHCVRYIATPDTLASDGKQHTLDFVGEIRLDETADHNQFQAFVQNGVASW